MIAVIDYNMGNLRSAVNAMSLLRDDIVLTKNPQDLRKADAIILPGVGAFGDGMENLQKLGFLRILNEEVLEKKKPFLGICIGMQLLSREGTEYGLHKGLGWVEGRTVLINPSDSSYKIPHMGWNELSVRRPGVLFCDIGPQPVYYFVHSYHLVPDVKDQEVITATCWHGEEISAALEKDNIFGVQFHPEKSQGAGLKLLSNFFAYVENATHRMSLVE